MLNQGEHAILKLTGESDYYLGGLTFEQIVSTLKITATTTDEQLDEIADTEQDRAYVEGRKIAKVREFVEHIREQVREAGEV